MRCRVLNKIRPKYGFWEQGLEKENQTRKDGAKGHTIPLVSVTPTTAAGVTS